MGISNGTFLQIFAQQRAFDFYQYNVTFRLKEMRKTIPAFDPENVHPLRYILQRPIDQLKLWTLLLLNVPSLATTTFAKCFSPRSFSTMGSSDLQQVKSPWLWKYHSLCLNKILRAKSQLKSTVHTEKKSSVETWVSVSSNLCSLQPKLINHCPWLSSLNSVHLSDTKANADNMYVHLIFSVPSCIYFRERLAYCLYSAWNEEAAWEIINVKINVFMEIKTNLKHYKQCLRNPSNPDMKNICVWCLSSFKCLPSKDASE